MMTAKTSPTTKDVSGVVGSAIGDDFVFVLGTSAALRFAPSEGNEGSKSWTPFRPETCFTVDVVFIVVVSTKSSSTPFRPEIRDFFDLRSLKSPSAIFDFSVVDASDVVVELPDEVVDVFVLVVGVVELVDDVEGAKVVVSSSSFSSFWASFGTSGSVQLGSIQLTGVVVSLIVTVVVFSPYKNNILFRIQ